MEAFASSSWQPTQLLTNSSSVWLLRSRVGLAANVCQQTQPNVCQQTQPVICQRTRPAACGKRTVPFAASATRCALPTPSDGVCGKRDRLPDSRRLVISSPGRHLHLLAVGSIGAITTSSEAECCSLVALATKQSTRLRQARTGMCTSNNRTEQ